MSDVLECDFFKDQSLWSTLFSNSPNLLCLIASYSSSSATAFLSASDRNMKVLFLLSTEYASSLRTFFAHLSETRPSIAASLIGDPIFRIVDWLVRSLVETVYIVPSAANTHRCLSFGTDTADWTAFLGVLGTITRNDKKQTQNAETPSGQVLLLCLLILLSASTDNVLSDAAVSEIACGCGLSEGEVKAILFETPLSFPIAADWMLKTDEFNTDEYPSVCASIGPTLLKWNSANNPNRSDPPEGYLTAVLVMNTLRCLVNVFNTVNPTFVPHPSFSPSLTIRQTMPSFWKAQPILTTLPALRTFVVQLSTLACSTFVRNNPLELRQRLSVEITAMIHILPHLDAPSKLSALALLSKQLSNYSESREYNLLNICEVVLELALSASYRTPTTLLQKTRQFVFDFVPIPQPSPFGGGRPSIQNELEASISDQLDMAEGEERWMLFTQLLCTTHCIPKDTIETMLFEAENDDQYRVVLSSLTLGAIMFVNQGVSFSDEGQTRLLRCAGQTNNVELASHAWDWIEKGCQLPTRPSMHGRIVGRMEVSEEMTNLLLKVLGDLTSGWRGEEREDDDGGAVESEKERKKIILSCLHILSKQIMWTNLDSTQFIPVLIQLTQNADAPTVCTLIEVFAGIATRTSNSANPISLSTIEVSVASQSSPVTQSLLSFVSSFLLKSILADPQSSFLTANPFRMQPQSSNMPIDVAIKMIWLKLEDDQSGTGESLMKRAIEIGCELLESTLQASENQPSPLNRVASLLTPQSHPNLSPFEIWRALHTLFSSPNQRFTTNTLFRLSEFFNRLVETILRASCDCGMSENDEEMSVKSFFSSIVASLMTPLVAVKQKEWAARPALLKLLHSTATLLIRHDSSLSDLSQFAENIYQTKQRGDGRKKMHCRTSRQHDTQSVDVIITTFAEEGVEDRVEVNANVNQRYLLFLGANANPTPFGMDVFANTPMANPFVNPHTDNPFVNTQTDNPFANTPMANPFVNPHTDNPFVNTQTDNPFGNPPTDNPFGHPPTDHPFGNPPTDHPFGNPPTDHPFGNPPTGNPLRGFGWV
ncbi:hypothetical protein BLNAU_2287 [Blattamonas nauphoetae]|uniref:Uncharacterized protein n=1 Tax=Blattamonas nauphoetae TaxID=2049346 RepID=A0ABQ9YGH3_9EUKA|nr:hypothetical protein BLNAU_2287 [Blattamonas nauphoetae]